MARTVKWTSMVAALALSAAGCRTAAMDRPVHPSTPPQQSQVGLMGQDEAARLGASYVANLGYEVELLRAQLDAETWVLAYALVGQPRKERFVIDVDARARTVRRLLDRQLEAEKPTP